MCPRNATVALRLSAAARGADRLGVPTGMVVPVHGLRLGSARVLLRHYWHFYCLGVLSTIFPSRCLSQSVDDDDLVDASKRCSHQGITERLTSAGRVEARQHHAEAQPTNRPTTRMSCDAIRVTPANTYRWNTKWTRWTRGVSFPMDIEACHEVVSASTRGGLLDLCCCSRTWLCWSKKELQRSTGLLLPRKS